MPTFSQTFCQEGGSGTSSLCGLIVPHLLARRCTMDGRPSHSIPTRTTSLPSPSLEQTKECRRREPVDQILAHFNTTGQSPMARLQAKANKALHAYALLQCRSSAAATRSGLAPVYLRSNAQSPDTPARGSQRSSGSTARNTSPPTSRDTRRCHPDTSHYPSQYRALSVLDETPGLTCLSVGWCPGAVGLTARLCAGSSVLLVLRLRLSARSYCRRLSSA
jgi:hypothetical protein